MTLLLAWLCLLDPLDLLALAPEEYQARGNRSEGIKPKPVSGFDIELISVLADFREAATGLPPSLRLRFFLREAASVHVTVREQRYEHYYWLDHVVPPAPWQPGFNEFSWPTGDVLRHVDPKFPIENLGAVVRLRQAQPSADETVAPAILYHSASPSTIGAYLFTLKPASDARLRCEIYAGDGDKPVWTTHIPMAVGDQPFSIRWPTGSSPAGPYRLVVTGFFLDNNQRFTQTVRFYHQPAAQ